MTVTKADGSPYPNCRVVMTILESVGVIQTQIGKYSYFTDSKGKALLAFTPQKPGEKVTITVDCGDNRAEYTAVVTGTAKGPELPKIDFTLPSIEQWQITSVAFIVVAVVILWKGKPFFDSLRKAAPKKKEQTSQEPEPTDMSPRRLITEHERKVAAKLAKKHRRKEIRLDHEFMRKL